MSRLTNDVDNISATISNSLSLLLTYSFTVAGIFGMMLYLSPFLTTVSLAGVGLIFLLTRTVTKHTRKLFSAQQKNLGALNGRGEESISGIAVVRALICSGYRMPLMNVINNLLYVAVSVLCGVLFVAGKISDIGLVTSFLLHVRQFTRPFVEIANIYNNFQTATALFAALVRDNICYGHPEASMEQVREAVRIVGADGFIERLPEGYDTILTQGAWSCPRGSGSC